MNATGDMNHRDDKNDTDERHSRSQEQEPLRRGATSGRWVRPVAFGAAGLLAGGLVTGTLSATAADTSSGGDGATTTPEGTSRDIDPSQPQRPDEKLLTGTTAEKVRAAALAKYPGATVVRIETDSDGVYEAHLTTSDGAQVTVEVNKDFAVTGTEQRRSGGPGAGPAGA